MLGVTRERVRQLRDRIGMFFIVGLPGETIEEAVRRMRGEPGTGGTGVQDGGGERLSLGVAARLGFVAGMELTNERRPQGPTPYQLAQRSGQEALRRTLLDAASRLLMAAGMDHIVEAPGDDALDARFVDRAAGLER